MRDVYRRHLGDKFSEGARLCWTAMDDLEVGMADVRKGVEAAPGTLTRVFYGDNLPNVGLASKLQDFFGKKAGKPRVPVSAWGRPPVEAFVPPAARPAA